MLVAYGLSEISAVASFNHPDRKQARLIGTPTWVPMRAVDEHGHEVPQDEVGEIVIRGQDVMTGAGAGLGRRPPRSRTGGSAPASWAGSTRTRG